MTYKMQTKEQIEHTIRRLLPEAKSRRKKILDIGTGHGLFLDICASHKNECVGIENDLENFNIASQKKHKIIFGDALNVFRTGYVLSPEYKFDIINLMFCLSLIFSRHCKVYNKELRWNFSSEMGTDFKCMASFFKMVTNKNGIVLIKSHNTKNSKKYSDFMVGIFKDNDFRLVINKKNITHKFRKLNAN